MQARQNDWPSLGDLSGSHRVSPDSAVRPPLKYEQLVHWAMQEWEQRYPGRAYRVVWADEDCAHNLARERLVPGRRMKGKARYMGYKPLVCPYSVPIDSFYTPRRKVVFTSSVGAFLFAFERAGQPFEALFVSAHHTENCGHGTVAIALVPPEHMDVWADFESQCNRAAYCLERSEKVYVIGGDERSFQPTVDWEAVILPDALKSGLRADVETFFSGGVGIYHQLNLPAFRKLLLVGPPGTGKSMLCAALAKLSLAQKSIVIYVSASDKDEADFDKIQRALRIASNSQHPTLLIIEELDAYLKPEDKSQILNVLDGFESPNNPRGALLIATTNYPEIIDKRIAKRPGRIDRIIYIPEIRDVAQAEQMLRHYMGAQWQDAHSAIINNLIGQTGAFVREVALYARMLAVHQQAAEVSLDLLRQSVTSLISQLAAGDNLAPRRHVGFDTDGTLERTAAQTPQAEG